jgi:hypothetical protein
MTLKRQSILTILCISLSAGITLGDSSGSYEGSTDGSRSNVEVYYKNMGSYRHDEIVNKSGYNVQVTYILGEKKYTVNLGTGTNSQYDAYEFDDPNYSDLQIVNVLYPVTSPEKERSRLLMILRLWESSSLGLTRFPDKHRNRLSDLMPT